MKPNPLSRPQRLAAGFTLIELMIAMVLVAILMSVAIPSYQSYVRRGQLSEAFSTLADVRVKMEQYYQDNKFYGVNSGSTACPTTLPTGAFPVAGKYFTISCELGNAGQTYRLTATGTGGLTTGYAYTVNQNGIKGTTSFAGASSSAACWLTKAGSCDN